MLNVLLRERAASVWHFESIIQRRFKVLQKRRQNVNECSYEIFLERICGRKKEEEERINENEKVNMGSERKKS
jgi:hypothetical protein